MAHLNYQKAPREARVPDAWLPATASLTEWLVSITHNHSIAAKVGPELAKPFNTALYLPALAEIQINADKILRGVDPRSVQFTDDLFRARNPLAVAAAIHEAAHARYSQCLPVDLMHALPEGGFSARHLEVIISLEEHRIEDRAVRAGGFPGLSEADARHFLPSLVFDFLAEEIVPDERRDHYGASIVVALVLARADAGLMSPDSVEKFQEIVGKFFTSAHIDEFLSIAKDFRDVKGLECGKRPSEAHARVLLDIANRWLTVVAKAVAEERVSDTPEDPEIAEEALRDAEEKVDRPAPSVFEDSETDSDETGEADSSDETGEPGEPGEPGETGSDETGEGSSDETGEGGETGEATSGEAGEAGEAGETGEGGEGGASEGQPADSNEALEKALQEIIEGDCVLREGVHDHDDPRNPDNVGSSDRGASENDSLIEAAEDLRHKEALESLDEVARIKRTRAQAVRELNRQRRESAAKAAEQVFNSPKAKDALRAKPGRPVSVASASTLSPRVPTAAERTAATQFARKIADAVTVEPVVTKVAKNRPGTKLRTRAVVQRRAQEAQGRRPTALHWEGKARHTADNPRLRVGVAVDVSGSMDALSGPLGLLAYVVGNGVNKIGGEFAQVAFGSSTTGVVKRGQPVSAIPVVQPADGSEQIKQAVLALDHELNLVDGDGVRVLIVASDGHFVTRDQEQWADEAFRALVDQGIILLHIDIVKDWDYSYSAASHPELRHNNPIPPLVFNTKMTAQEISHQIGERILEEVAKVNKKSDL